MAASLLSVTVAASSSSSPLLQPCNTSIPNLSTNHDHSSSPTKIRTRYYPSHLLKPKTLIFNHKISQPPFMFLRSPATAAFDSLVIEKDDEEEEDSRSSEEREAEEQKKQHSADSGRLFVGNLPYAVTSSELLKLFGEAGCVRSVEIIHDRVTDRSRGFGFVTMGSLEEAKIAVRLLHGSLVGGRTMKVNFPEVPRGAEREVMDSKIQSGYQGFVDTPFKIYAGNLSWNLTSQGLTDVFSEHSGFVSAKVIFQRDSGRSRGFGFVSFTSAEEAEAAISAMNGVEVEGRPLRLNLSSINASPASPPAADLQTKNSLDSSELLFSMIT